MKNKLLIMIFLLSPICCFAANITIKLVPGTAFAAAVHYNGKRFPMFVGDSTTLDKTKAGETVCVSVARFYSPFFGVYGNYYFDITADSPDTTVNWWGTTWDPKNDLDPNNPVLRYNRWHVSNYECD